VALSEMEHKTDKLFEPAGRVFGRRVMSLAPQSRALSEGMPRCNCHLAEYKIAARPRGRSQ